MLSLKLLVTLLSELSGSPMLLLTLGKDLTPLVFGWSEVTPQLLSELAQIISGGSNLRLAMGRCEALR